MVRQKQMILTWTVMLLFIFVTYLYIFNFKNDQGLFYFFGEAVYTFLPLLASIFLFMAFKKTPSIEKPFWLLLSIGFISTFIAEVIWDYYELLLNTNVPFPGSSDIFYILHILLFLCAFLYRMRKEENRKAIFKYLLNASIIMTVTATYGWYYFIKPIINTSDFTVGYQVVSIGYPLADLFLLILASSVFWDTSNIVSKSFLYLYMGLFVVVIADSVYLYLQAVNSYSSWSLVDPLYLLSYMLVGFSGYQRTKEQKESAFFLNQNNTEEPSTDFKLILPYIYVLTLCIFLLFTQEFSIVLGTFVSILLIIVQQISSIIDNRRLLDRFEQQTAMLSINEQRYRSLFDHHTDAIFTLDIMGNFKAANKKCISYFEKTHEELMKSTIYSFFPLPIKYEVLSCFTDAKKGDPQHHVVSYDMNGTKYLSITYIPIIVNNRVDGVFGIAKDITEIKENEVQKIHLANHDALTELPNRRYFDKKLDSALAQAQLNGKKLALLFIDMDHFKIINDTLGHSFGDQLLINVAEKLKQTIGYNDIVARQGGDEFIILLKDIVDESDVIRRSEKLLEQFNRPFVINQHRVSVTPSIGISIYPNDADSAQELMKNADMAMYRVKHQGKNHYKIYRSLNDDKSFRKLTIEKDIHTVIKKDQLEVYYQPQVAMDGEEIVGVEALVRWNHPDLGLVNPGEFIPLAEAIGTIFSINEWVLEEACKQLKYWHNQGHVIKVAVNISPQQFYHEFNLVEKVKEILMIYDIDPSYLVVEITETIAINNMDVAIDKLVELKKLGVLIALDDFGTGYSSLSYLTMLPIDTIKIAREFIDQIGVGSANEAVLASLVSLANDLNYIIVIEGVETEEQWNKLKHSHSHIMQGYYFSRPLPVHMVNKLLENKATVS